VQRFSHRTRRRLMGDASEILFEMCRAGVYSAPSPHHRATVLLSASKKKPPGLSFDQASGFAEIGVDVCILMRLCFPLFFDFCGNNTLQKRALANSRVFKFVKYTKTLPLRNQHD
jgi:hypothetical protein